MIKRYIERKRDRTWGTSVSLFGGDRDAPRSYFKEFQSYFKAIYKDFKAISKLFVGICLFTSYFKAVSKDFQSNLPEFRIFVYVSHSSLNSGNAFIISHLGSP